MTLTPQVTPTPDPSTGPPAGRTPTTTLSNPADATAKVVPAHLHDPDGTLHSSRCSRVNPDLEISSLGRGACTCTPGHDGIPRLFPAKPAPQPRLWDMPVTPGAVAKTPKISGYRILSQTL